MTDWVKVSERLPDASDECIVVLTYEELGRVKRAVTVGRYYPSEFERIWFVGGEPNFDVTHWIPFPEPPEDDR